MPEVTRKLSVQHGGGEYTFNLSAETIAVQAVEEKIMREVLTRAKVAGWDITGAHDGDEEYRYISDDDMILIAQNLDEVRFFFRKTPIAHGWVYFIFGNGNGGRDVISDYTTNLEEFMDGINPDELTVIAPIPTTASESQVLTDMRKLLSVVFSEYPEHDPQHAMAREILERHFPGTDWRGF